MNRKFRAWYKNEMYDWDRLIHNENNNYFPSLFHIFLREEIKDMEWIGLTDRHGIDIYEGDIIKVGDVERTSDDKVIYHADGGGYYIAQVIYNTASFAILEPSGRMRQWWNFDGSRTIEVIGNIYKNPDLFVLRTTIDEPLSCSSNNNV